MTRPSATCELYVEDTRVPDAGVQLASGRPTALDGLKLVWGRDDQNEQPGPASATFEILDPEGDEDVLDTIHVGSMISIWAQGQITSTDYGRNVYDNGTFAGKADGPVPASEVWLVTSPVNYATRADYRTEQMILTATGTIPSGSGATVPPRVFSPLGTLPNAWDDIPRMTANQKCLIEFDWCAPRGFTFSAWLRGFTSPYIDAQVPTTYSTGQELTGDGTWHHYSGSFKFSPIMGTLSVWPAIGFQSLNWTATQRARWADQRSLIWSDAPSTWNDFTLYGTSLMIDNLSLRPPPVTTRRVLVFSGEVSDLTVEPYGWEEATLIKGTAMDLGADLGNTVVGDEPWPVQSLTTRANRIATLSGITSSPKIRIDTPLGDLQVSYRDIDAQPAFGLLQDLAQTGAGVLWVATHAVTGPYLWIENPGTRSALRQFTLSGGVIVITGAAAANLLSACDVLEDGVTWRQDTADVITVVAVTWQEQGTDEDGLPMTTERTVTIKDTAAIETYGTRRLSVTTDLISDADATAMANRLIAQARTVPWRIEGLTVDTDPSSMFEEITSLDDRTRAITLLDLLDGTTRMGYPLTVVDMPGYAPRGAVSSYYVEGGSYTFDGGYWQLALGATPATGQGASAAWADFAADQPTWTWSQWSPGLRWADAFGTTV